MTPRAAYAALLAAAALGSRDAPARWHGSAAPGTIAPVTGPASLRCQGRHAPLPSVLLYELRSGAFPDASRPDVGVHVPAGFDPSRRPGLVVYFHGWRGCVAGALGSIDAPCSEGGTERPASDLVTAMDAANVNAMLVAIELRVDMATGESGRMAAPGGLRELLRELFTERLAEPLGCTLEVDALDRAIVIAHSGGYQAAANVLALGDVPRIGEVALLDALYGGDEVFFRWFESRVTRFDPGVEDTLRLIDVYTCCGGTADASRAMARRARSTLAEAGLTSAFSDAPPGTSLSTHSVVFAEVPGPHGQLPRVYFRDLVATAGFAPIEKGRTADPASYIGADESHPVRPN